MHVHDLLVSMRRGEVQPDAAIEAFVQGVTDGSISRPQAASWLAWAFSRTLTPGETLALTRAMTASGPTLSWGDGPPLVDKHSTGGVGDKVSLILAPLWASLGLRVPMIAGRGLGHTGGTLDKLEAIPGFRTDLDNQGLQRCMRTVGGFISGQTATLAPADRVLYALRNETSTVESIPLIVGSILSKKLAEGVQRLVLDVKVGSGAFMKDVEQASALARALVDVATGAGVHCIAHLTAMERVLGVAVGNALEVQESIDCLRGGGPSDLRALTLALADHPDAERALDDGSAYERFLRMVEAQGGDVAALEGGLLGAGCQVHVVEADYDGIVVQADALELGWAAFQLGAGRARAEDPVDPGVGLEVLARPGQVVVRGEPLVRIHHRSGRALDEATARVAAAMRIGQEPSPVPALVQATFRATGPLG